MTPTPEASKPRPWITIAVVCAPLLWAAMYYRNEVSVRSVNHLVVLTYGHDVSRTLSAMFLEWESFREQFGREPESEAELFAARPGLRYLTGRRAWSGDEGFAFVIPPLSFEGDRLLALSPNVHLIQEPPWPRWLHGRLGRYIDDRYAVTVEGRHTVIPKDLDPRRSGAATQE